MIQRIIKKTNEIIYRFKRGMEDENGMGVIEVVLIILVLVGLALIFKKQISSIATGLLGSVKEQVGTFS